METPVLVKLPKCKTALRQVLDGTGRVKVSTIPSITFLRYQFLSIMELWRNFAVQAVSSFGRDVKPVVPLVQFNRSRLRAGTRFHLLPSKERENQFIKKIIDSYLYYKIQFLEK